MKNENEQKQVDVMKYLLYAVIGLLIANLVFLFLPFVETYMPTRSVTTLFGTRYEGWETHYYPVAISILPVIISAVIYLCSIIRFFVKREKSAFTKITNNTAEKPIHFVGLKLSVIVHAIGMVIISIIGMLDTDSYEEYGAYSQITLLGVLHIILLVALFALLFVFSVKSKKVAEEVTEAKIRERMEKERALKEENASDVTFTAVSESAVGEE